MEPDQHRKALAGPGLAWLVYAQREVRTRAGDAPVVAAVDRLFPGELRHAQLELLARLARRELPQFGQAGRSDQPENEVGLGIERHESLALRTQDDGMQARRVAGSNSTTSNATSSRPVSQVRMPVASPLASTTIKNRIYEIA